MHRFLQTGVGLCQCDWACLLRRHGHSLDGAALAADLRSLGMLRAVGALARWRAHLPPLPARSGRLSSGMAEKLDVTAGKCVILPASRNICAVKWDDPSVALFSVLA